MASSHPGPAAVRLDGRTAGRQDGSTARRLGPAGPPGSWGSSAPLAVWKRSLIVSRWILDDQIHECIDDNTHQDESGRGFWFSREFLKTRVLSLGDANRPSRRCGNDTREFPESGSGPNMGSRRRRRMGWVGEAVLPHCRVAVLPNPPS